MLETRFFYFIFLVVFDVGDEDKEECGGTKDLGGLGLGWKKARPLLRGWLGGNNVTIKKQRIISEQTLYFVYTGVRTEFFCQKNINDR